MYNLPTVSSEVVRKLFEPKMQKVIGGWRKLCKEELHDYCVRISKYCQGYQIQGHCMDKACGIKDTEEKCIQDFGGGTYRIETIWKIQAQITFKIIRK